MVKRTTPAAGALKSSGRPDTAARPLAGKGSWHVQIVAGAVDAFARKGREAVDAAAKEFHVRATKRAGELKALRDSRLAALKARVSEAKTAARTGGLLVAVREVKRAEEISGAIEKLQAAHRGMLAAADKEFEEMIQKALATHGAAARAAASTKG